MITEVVRWLFLKPLKKLYFGGPSLGGWGFWEGAQEEDICASLTHVDAIHWSSSKEGAEMCQSLLDRKFTAFAVGITAMVTAAFVVAVTTQSIHYCLTIRPLLKRIDTAVHRLSTMSSQTPNDQ